MFLCFVSQVALATNYYVNDGSTANDVAFPGCSSMGTGVASSCGACSTPCNHPQLAYDTLPLVAGDTVYINSGTYSGSAGQPILNLSGAKSGSSAANLLTFTGPLDSEGYALRGPDGKPLVVLDGQTVAVAGVWVGVSYVQVSGLGLTNFQCAAPPYYGSAVRLDDSSTTLQGWRFTGLDTYGLPCATSSGFDVDLKSGSCSGCEISFSRFYNSPNAGEAIFLLGVGGTQIHHNLLMDQKSTVSAGISLHACANTVISNNLIRGFGGPAIWLGACPQSTYCGANGTAGTQILNNTLVENQTRVSNTGELFLNGKTLGTTARNNIIVPRNDPTAAVYRLEEEADPPTGDFNGFFLQSAKLVTQDVPPSYDDLASVQSGLGQELSSLVGDPLFASDAGELSSQAGRLLGDGGYTSDAVTSPFLDVGDPAASFGNEPSPNGDRLNLGHQGNTPYASVTPISFTAVSVDGGTAVVQTRYPGGPAAQVALAGAVVSGNGTITPSFVSDFNGLGTASFSTPSDAEFQISVEHAPGITAIRFTVIDGGTVTTVTGGQTLDPFRYVAGCDCTQSGGLSPWLGFLGLVLLSLFSRRGSHRLR